jgi:hypothetical protein
MLAAICDLVAEDETRPVLCIEIKQDAATQHKHPQISAFVVGGLGSTCRHLRRAFSAALKRRLEVLMSQSYDDRFPCLVSAGVLHHESSRHTEVVRKALQIHASAAAPGTRCAEGPVRRVHALAAFIPIQEMQTIAWLWGVRLVTELVVVFVTDRSKSELSPSRLQLVIPTHPGSVSDPSVEWASREARTALNEIKQAVKGTKWTGSMRYYMLWFDYVVRYTRDLC